MGCGFPQAGLVEVRRRGFRESGQQFGGRQDEDRGAGEVLGFAGDDGV